jgi:hypothetical protein
MGPAKPFHCPVNTQNAPSHHVDSEGGITNDTAERLKATWQCLIEITLYVPLLCDSMQ